MSKVANLRTSARSDTDGSFSSMRKKFKFHNHFKHKSFVSYKQTNTSNVVVLHKLTYLQIRKLSFSVMSFRQVITLLF